MEGDYQVYLLQEVPMLTNCLQAILEYRKQHGEYWPSLIIISRGNRLEFGFGEGIALKRADADDSWIVNNALYLGIDNPLHDPVIQRRATVPPIHVRQPVEDVYQQVYRRRTTTAYVMSLPEV